VRIEDLDPQRSRPEFERRQLDDLRVLGLDWDEAPVRQSERMPLYEDALARLEAQGRLYPCFCTRAEIREAASAPHDALPGYQLAVVVDDGAQGVGEVVRGDDLLDSTPRQILLARLLGLPVPRYAHVPLVFGTDGVRMAKRSRPPSLSERREPPAVTLALLAHTLGLALGSERVRQPAELLAEFDPARLPPEPCVLG
jgi:glutamyl-tRNA synthetase